MILARCLRKPSLSRIIKTESNMEASATSEDHSMQTLNMPITEKEEQHEN